MNVLYDILWEKTMSFENGNKAADVVKPKVNSIIIYLENNFFHFATNYFCAHTMHAESIENYQNVFGWPIFFCKLIEGNDD